MTQEEAIKIFRKEIECLSHTKCEDCILEKACDPMNTTPYDSEYIEAFSMAIKALEQEPTTKNDLVTLTFSKGTLKYSCKDYVVYKKDWLRSHYGAEIDIMFGDSQYKEPTTKNDLGVDCISREQALVAIRNLYPSMPRVDFNGSLRKWVDKYKPYIECDDAIKQLPSVTPQEPRCKDCKWWKDSDGKYRRGSMAESMCPINTKTVFLGEGYCYRFEPQESEE